MSSAVDATLESPPVAEASAATSTKHERIPPLDGVRGVAILLVLLGHTAESLVGEFGLSNPLLRMGLLGWAGVDLFFVLSGFLITGILCDAKEKPHYFKNFYARRTLRIFPLYYGVLLLVLILSLIIPTLSISGEGHPGWIWAYLTNFMIGINGAGSFGMLDHFWSLAVEEHFYLVWPALVLLLNRRTLMFVAAAALVVALLLRVSVTDMETGMSMSGYMFTPMRMDALAAGSLIALAARGPAGIGGLVKFAVVVGPLAFATFALLVLWRHTPEYSDPFIGTIGLSLLWAAFGSALVLSLTWAPLSRLMSGGFLRWFGKYSYGLYVWHPIVIIPLMHTDWARSLRGDSVLLGCLMMAFALALSIGIALVSWNVLEKQFLKLKVKFA